MIINIICAECGEKMTQGFAEFADGELTLTVLRHECKPNTAESTLSDAVMACDGDMVEIGYFKKDGSFVTMTGYFKGNSPMSKIGYEFFMKEQDTGFVPRNLIRRGITSVYRIKEEFTYIIS